MIQAILILAVLITIVLLAKLGGLEAIINGVVAVVGFIGSLFIATLVIGIMCVVGIVVIPIFIIVVICMIIAELIGKVKKK